MPMPVAGTGIATGVGGGEPAARIGVIVATAKKFAAQRLIELIGSEKLMVAVTGPAPPAVESVSLTLPGAEWVKSKFVH